MPPESERVFSDALQLPADARARLAGQLLESLDEQEADRPDEVERAWAEEIGRRVTALDNGQAQTVTWTELQDRISRSRP